MSDIFISYATEDRERAMELAHCLESRGWTVWWDREIPFGKSFDQVIEAQIAAARCVIVLWTAASVASEWVKNEAREGRSRGVLIPIQLDQVRLPLEFRDAQTANLIGWHADVPNAEFDKLVHQLQAQIATQPKEVAHAPANLGAPREQAATRVAAAATRRRGRMVASVVAAVMALGGGAVMWQKYFAEHRIPNLIQLQVKQARQQIENAGFAVGEEQPIERADAAPGTVLSHSPAAGERRPKGGRIDLRVATVPLVEVPDVLGTPVSRAKELLERRGLAVGRIVSATSRSQQPGEVLRQDPRAGDRVESGKAIALVLAAKPAVVVPDVVGKPAGPAKEVLRSVGLAVEIRMERTKAMRPGLVLRQDPPAGGTIEEGAAVTVVVAEQATVPVPNLIGMTVTRARSVLGASGLSVGPIDVSGFAAVPEATVRGQRPAFGAGLSAGGAVNLVVVEPGIAVPEVTGRPLEQARTELATQGLQIRSVTQVPAQGVRPGWVVSQTPLPGSVVRRGTDVLLTIAQQSPQQAQLPKTWAIPGIDEPFVVQRGHLVGAKSGGPLCPTPPGWRTGCTALDPQHRQNWRNTPDGYVADGRKVKTFSNRSEHIFEIPKTKLSFYVDDGYLFDYPTEQLLCPWPRQGVGDCRKLDPQYEEKWRNTPDGFIADGRSYNKIDVMRDVRRGLF